MMSTMNEIEIFSCLNNIQFLPLRGYEVVSYVLVTMNKIIDIFVLGQ